MVESTPGVCLKGWIARLKWCREGGDFEILFSVLFWLGSGVFRSVCKITTLHLNPQKLRLFQLKAPPPL